MEGERGKKLVTAALGAIALAYAFGLLLMTGLLFPSPQMRFVQYVPFVFIKELAEDPELLPLVLWNNLGNVALFIPMGVLLPAFFGKLRLVGSVLIGFLISLGVETAQYVFALGVSDVDDLILNTLGTLIGALIYLGLFARHERGTRSRAAAAIFLTLFGLAILAALFLR